MNTIPLIFNERHIERTVLGGITNADNISVFDSKVPCSLILLNRGSNHYRQQNIDALLKVGFAEVISVENSSLSYNLEDFALRHPQVKFIVPQEKLTIGDMINIGITECSTEYAFVIWNDMHISSNLMNASLYESLVSDSIFCISPVLQSPSLQTLPVKMIPNIEKGRFAITPSTITNKSEKTLYSFDFIGMYNRQKFMQLGGYDYTITNPYWQNIDLSLRAWLWGEEIRISNQFKLKYEEETPLEDITADFTQLRFYLKNCAPTFKTDYAYIPVSSFFMFSGQFPGSPFEALNSFKDARKWVHTNRYRFKTDVVNLIQKWNDNFDSELSDGTL